jgi:hypothetical protein
MKIDRTLIAITASIALLCACDRASNRPTEKDPAAATAETKDEALVRVIQAHPAAPQADVYAGDQKTFAGVGFGTVTPYKPVPDEFKLVFKPAGQPDGPVLMESQSGVKAGQRYTVLAEPDRDGAAKIDVVTDKLGSPPPGKALVRIIHADPEAGAVDVYNADKADKPILDGVNYGAPAHYEEFDPANVKVRVSAKSTQAVPSKDQRPPVLMEVADVQAGKAYTLVITPGAEPGQPVKMIKVEDPLEGAPASASRLEPSGKQNAIQREPDTKDDGVYELHPEKPQK